MRQATGYSRLAVVELLLGAIVLVGSGVGLSRARPLAWSLVFMTLSLTFAATWAHARRVRILVEKRRESEALRLETFIRTGER